MPVDETCPVCRTADIVCGKWTLLLVRELAEGRSRFCELERSLAGLSQRTLSLRLRALAEEGIVERATFPAVPPRVEYALAEKGRALVRLLHGRRADGERGVVAAFASARPAPGRRARRPRGVDGGGWRRPPAGRQGVRRPGRRPERGRPAATRRGMAGSLPQCAVHRIVQMVARPELPSPRWGVRRSRAG